jgi:hypothetical protein
MLVMTHLLLCTDDLSSLRAGRECQPSAAVHIAVRVREVAHPCAQGVAGGPGWHNSPARILPDDVR